MELKPTLQWNDDSPGSQCKVTSSISYFTFTFQSGFNSLCGRSTVQNKGCHPSSTFLCLNKLPCIIPPLLLPIHHQLTQSEGGTWNSCSFSFLLLFQRGCATASATLLFTLGHHQGNLLSTGISTSSDAFWGNTKSLESVRSNINNYRKNKRELLNTKTSPGNAETRN